MKMKVRLALREEGAMWNAYLAKIDTMEGAKLIGSISMGPVRRQRNIKLAFQKLMQDVLADGVHELTGETIENWDIQPAPESERGGNA